MLVAPPTIERELLTIDGANNLRPERDTFLYVAAGVIAIGASLVLSRLTPLRRRGPLSPLVARWLPFAVSAGSMLVASVAFLRVRRTLPLRSSGSLAYLALAVVLAMVCLVAAKVSRQPNDVGTPRRSHAGDATRARPGLLDVIVPLLVIGLVYLPGWPQLAGNAFAGEGALHLDFFAFGPALAFRSGVALGTDLHTYYGLGWPMVFSLLDPLSYAHIIRVEVIYGCAYFIGVYVLLRVLVGDRRWAAAGTALAILFQLFAGFAPVLVMWRYPSATIMRWPFDVWFFLACLLHLRTGRTRWTVVAAACVALAVVFETDTGLALGAAFAFFWLCLWRLDPPGTVRKQIGWSSLAAGPLVFVGLGVASRWTIFTGAFWDGWLENLRASAMGATFLPLTTQPPTRSVILFELIAVTYLVVLGYAAVQLAARRVSPTAALLGCIALYGFLTLLYFVGRSNPDNLFRPAVPFAILIAALGGLAHRHWLATDDGRPTARRLGAGAVAWTALAVSAAMLVAHPGTRAYPSLIRSIVTADPARGVCLFEHPDDICGLPPEAQQTVDDLRALAARLRSLGSEDASVAVLDEIGPVIQHMAGARPWGRYLPVFPGLFTRAQVAAVAKDLGEDPPSLVVMRPRAEDRPFYADTWQQLRVPVERGFVLDSQEGPFQIWRRR